MSAAKAPIRGSFCLNCKDREGLLTFHTSIMQQLHIRVQGRNTMHMAAHNGLSSNPRVEDMTPVLISPQKKIPKSISFEIFENQ